ncbi:hypothetical protein [Actinomyces ruminis]|nr:hypothetical protein [Actinomyces ruminis]
MSGAETAKWLESPDGAAFDLFHRNNNNDDPEGLEEQKARYSGYESYADDEEGYWYVATCSSAYMADDDPRDFYDVIQDYVASHAPVWVPAGESAPVPEVDGATLAQAAWDSVTIPTATISYNPMYGGVGATFVGMDTWVWATGDTPKEVTVTATAGSTTATITLRRRC